MLVGILTYHRSHNYGALLQAIALRKVVSNLGYNVKYVDYWPEYHQKMYSLFRWGKAKKDSLKEKIMLIVARALAFPYKYIRWAKFKKFIKINILPYSLPGNFNWDIIICGSDQIWRKQAGLGNQFNPVYFGAGNIKSRSFISYAASMGVIDVNNDDKVELKLWLERFLGISVREESLKDLLIKAGLGEIITVLDPTLLLSKKEWLSLIKIKPYKQSKQKYLLLYELIEGSFDMNEVKKYADIKGWEVKILKGKTSIDSFRKNTFTTIDPFDMVEMIRGAEMVFTSSYHGLVFSIIFNRQFVTSFKYNSGRAKALLEKLSLSERIVPIKSNSFPTKIINYTEVNQKLEDLREGSITWLKQSLMLVQKNNF